MTYPLMLYNKQTNKQKFSGASSCKKPPNEQKSSWPIIVIVLARKKNPTELFFLLKKLDPRGGQQRALSDQQSVSLVHFHLLLISQEPPSCSATPAVTSPNSHFGMAAGFPIGRDAVMSRYINELIKQNACGRPPFWGCA